MFRASVFAPYLESSPLRDLTATVATMTETPSQPTMGSAIASVNQRFADQQSTDDSTATGPAGADAFDLLTQDELRELTVDRLRRKPTS